MRPRSTTATAANGGPKQNTHGKHSAVARRRQVRRLARAVEPPLHAGARLVARHSTIALALLVVVLALAAAALWCAALAVTR